MTDDEKKAKRYVTVADPKRLVIGDPDISDDERAAIREQETMRICPCCGGAGMVTHVEATKWEKRNDTIPDTEPEGAA